MLISNLDNGFVQGVLVLLQPSSQVVRDHGSVVNDTKVSLGVTSLQVRLTEVGMFAQKISVQLCLKGLIRGLRVDGLFLENRQDAHRLLEQLQAGSKVHPKVAGDPDDSLAHVLLLLQHEHGVVEELKD